MVKNVRIMFGFTKKMFIELSTSLVNASIHTKCESLRNQQCTTQPTFFNLDSNEYTKGFHYYPFAVNLDRFVRSCSILNDLSNKVCVLNKTSIFNMITAIIE